jgi:hypothetical protein
MKFIVFSLLVGFLFEKLLKLLGLRIPNGDPNTTDTKRQKNMKMTSQQKHESMSLPAHDELTPCSLVGE